MRDMSEIMQRLRQPFHPDDITWKPGATTKDGTKCMAMAYGDLRAYMDTLDDVCGSDWQAVYTPWGDRLICSLTIHGVTRSSTGEYDAQDAKTGIGGTVAEAQAFKRAAAMFGLGRYLYDLPSVWVAYDAQAKKISKAGQDELDRRYRTWYEKAIKAQPITRTVDTTTGEITSPEATAQANPFDDATPYFVTDWNKLTGKAYDLVKWVSILHDKSDGPCTKAQYGFLTGIVNDLSNGEHNYTLSVLCQSHISSDNLPGAKVAEGLLKILAKTVKVKVEGGTQQDVPNPDYRQDIAELITGIAKQAQPVTA